MLEDVEEDRSLLAFQVRRGGGGHKDGRNFGVLCFPEVSDDHTLEFQFPGEDSLYNQNNEALRGTSRQRASEAFFEAASKYIDNTGTWKEPHLSKNEGGKSNQGGLDQANIVHYTNINASQYGVASEQISKGSFAKVLGSWTIPAGFPGLATSPLFTIPAHFKEDGAINVIFVKGIEGATGAGGVMVPVEISKAYPPGCSRTLPEWEERRIRREERYSGSEVGASLVAVR